MNEQHTPGPWFPTKDSKYNEVARIGRAWNIGTELALSHFGDVDADARLIAAAPDMLYALRRAVLALAFAAESSKAMQDDYEAVSLAIAKATGASA